MKQPKQSPERALRLQAGVKPLQKRMATLAPKGRQNVLPPLRGLGVHCPDYRGFTPACSLFRPSALGWETSIRKKSGAGVYHVMLRGINRQDIFEDDEDYMQMTSILRGQSERYDENGHRLSPFCTFYAYCLMSNHLHLLIQERDETVSDIVKRIGVTYAHYFNKKYERSGHLFQDRFRSEPVDNIEYFVTLLRYIHQNPLKAGIIANMNDYPWSSWKEYSSEYSSVSFCSTSAVFARIGQADIVELINTPIEADGQIMDIDTDGNKSMSDSDVKAFLQESQGIANPRMVQSLEKTRRNEVLRYALYFGAGVRQMSRLTGVSFGVVQKLTK